MNDMRIKTTLITLAIIALSTVPLGRLAAQTLEEAIVYTESEQFGNADKAFQSLVSQQPQNGTNYYYFGDSFIKRFLVDSVSTTLEETTKNARAQFEKGNNAEPANPLNLIGLGEVALFKKDIAAAKSYFDQAIALLPTKKNKIKMDKELNALAYIKIADAYVKSQTKDTAAIFSMLREAQKVSPKNIEAYLVRGDAYNYLLNDGSQAVSNYNNAARINTKSPAAQLKLGQLWKRARDYESALKQYQLVTQIDPNYAIAYKELGYLNSQLGNTQAAKDNFKKFLSLSSGNNDAQLQYINTLFQLKDYAEVATQAQAMLNNNSSNADLYRALGYSEVELGKNEAATATLDKLFKNSAPEKIRIADYVYYARALANMKNDVGAGDYYLKAFKLNEAQYDYLDNAIKFYTSAGDQQKILDAYKLKNPDYYTVTDNFYIGVAYMRLKQYELAAEKFQLVIDKSPDFMTAYQLRAASLNNLDTDVKGLAMPAYQLLLDKTASDPTKYANERGEAYSYMNYYYYQQYQKGQVREDARKAIDFGQKALEIDPNNANAKTINDYLVKYLRSLDQKAKR